MAARAFRVLQLNVLLISFALIFFSKNDRNLFFGSRRESLKPGSISRLRVSCQQLDSESDKEKQPPFVSLARDYPIRWSYVNFSQSVSHQNLR